MTKNLAIPTFFSQVKYHFDGYLGNSACGWIFSEFDPDEAIAVGVYADEKLIASGYANIFREDLALQKVGNGSCSFKLPLPLNDDFTTLEVRILDTDFILVGSQQRSTQWDMCVDQLTKKFRFEKYSQFSELENISAVPKAYQSKRSNRLTQEFSKFQNSDANIPALMEWTFSTERQGGAGFFETSSHHLLDNVAWYLFDYKSPAKRFLPTSAMAQFFTPLYPNMSGMEHYSIAYSIWLHKHGIRLSDIAIDGREHYFGFLSSLLSANTPICKNNLPNWITASVKKYLSLKEEKLPQISKYAEMKYERSYQQYYDMTNAVHYLAYLFDVTLHCNSDEASLMGDEVISFFKSPVVVSNGFVSRFTLIVWSYYKKNQSNYREEEEEEDAFTIKSWFESVWLKKFPNHILYIADDSIPDHRHVDEPDKKCYIISHWENMSGLTKNAHMSAQALGIAGIPVIKVLLDGSIIESYENNLYNKKTNLNRDVVILHVNADKAPEALAALAAHIDLDDAHIVGFYLWELETIPQSHLLGLALIDELWAPTNFIKEIYSPYIFEKIKHVGKAISVPNFTEIVPEKFGISRNSTSFLITYDINSGIERKNPLAAIRAFQAEFSHEDDVQMIVKTTPYKPGHWGDPFNQWGQILNKIVNDDRFVIIDTYISDNEMFELIASVDVVVSTHRSEGFGYLPAYGLIYDRQVIATGYSGVTDFIPLSDMLAADFSMVDVPCEKFVYPVPGAQWAEIDTKHLRKLMRGCHQEKKLNTISENSNDRFREFFSYEKLSQRYICALKTASII